jgi:hypothetical protein
VEAEGFHVGGVGGADFFGEGSEGGVEGEFVEVRKLGDVFVHGLFSG